MVLIDKFEFGEVRYADCMNEVNGLPTLEDKSIDLCLTDPPYNINAKIPTGFKYNHNRDDEIILYNDQIKYYKSWCISWFNELKRICKRIMFTPGKTNLKMWYDINDFYLVIWDIPNISSRGFISKFMRVAPILCYGNFKQNKLTFDIIRCYVNSGFLVKKNEKVIHPHPKPSKLYNIILKQMKPKSVIDPFLGSGTTAEVCTKLGIPWLGYEINEVYKVDIDKRLKGCKREPQQINLEVFR